MNFENYFRAARCDSVPLWFFDIHQRGKTSKPHRQHVNERGINHGYKKRLHHNPADAFAVALLVFFAVHFLKVAQVLEIIQMKKSEEDAELIPDLEVDHDHGKGRKDEGDPAQQRIAVGKTADGKSCHQHGKKSEKLFSYGNLPLAHVAHTWLVSLFRFHVQ